MARRPLAAALILGAGALALTGCIPMPPAVPVAPTSSPIESSTPAAPTESSEPAGPGASEPSEPQAGAFDFTVDDGLGDTWSFSVTGLEENPPLTMGEPEEGTRFVALIIDGEHLEGSVSFRGAFDMLIEGTDGETYDFADTFATVTAENDIYEADDTAFTGARAAIQLPDGVDPARVILRSAYGYPEVADTVIEVQ